METRITSNLTEFHRLIDRTMEPVSRPGLVTREMRFIRSHAGGADSCVEPARSAQFIPYLLQATFF